MNKKEINLELMVELIKSHDCLYNYSLKSYKNKKLKEKTWLIIANELNTDVWNLKKKWKNMRDSYTKEIKKGNDNEKRKRWRYMEMLSFLNNNVFVKKENNDSTEKLDMDYDDELTMNEESNSNTSYVKQFLMADSKQEHHETLTIEPIDLPEYTNPLQFPTSSSSSGCLKKDNETKKHKEITKVVEDQDDFFGLSVAGRLKELSKEDNFFVKMKIMEIFYNLARK